MHPPRMTSQALNVDIDFHINRYVPRNQLHRLPKCAARFLGYREKPVAEVGNVLIWLWSLLGAFCGLVVTAAVFRYSPGIQKYNPPIIFASLGATAILDYNAIQSPLAQPRASILGHVLAATVGVAITRLFMLSPDFESLRWIAGAVCCGVASAVMGITNTVHPPGGATALLAAVDPTVSNMGWMLVPLVLLGSVIMLICALLVNNIQRQFPTFWWTPRDVGRTRRPDIETANEHAKGKLNFRMPTTAETRLFERVSTQRALIITPESIIIPDGFGLGGVEASVVETLRDRLRNKEERWRPSSASDITAAEEKEEDDRVYLTIVQA